MIDPNRPDLAQRWLGTSFALTTLSRVAQMPDDRLRDILAYASPAECDRLQFVLQAVMETCDHIEFQGAQRAWDMIAELRASRMAEPFPEARQEPYQMKDPMAPEESQRQAEAARKRDIAQAARMLHVRLLPVAAQILSGIAAARMSPPTADDAQSAARLAITLDEGMEALCHQVAAQRHAGG